MSRTRSPMLMLGLLALFALFVGSVTGCGYSAKTNFPTDVQSVQVKMFGNRSFYRGVEFDLTEALVKEIELRSPYKVVSNAAADTLMEGTVVGVNQIRLSRRREGGLPQEMEVQILVDFVWRNQRTGKIITDRKGLTVIGRYVPAAEETRSAGQHEAVQKMATQIVSAMAAQW